MHDSCLVWMLQCTLAARQGYSPMPAGPHAITSKTPAGRHATEGHHANVTIKRDRVTFQGGGAIFGCNMWAPHWAQIPSLIDSARRVALIPGVQWGVTGA